MIQHVHSTEMPDWSQGPVEFDWNHDPKADPKDVSKRYAALVADYTKYLEDKAGETYKP